jgi:hypothetical protein
MLLNMHTTHSVLFVLCSDLQIESYMSRIFPIVAKNSQVPPPDGPRAALERLIAERREDYAGLSRLLGRNPAYIQQYVKRGSPRLLAEEDRRALARYFDVPESLLGGREDPAPNLVAAQAGAAAWRGADLIAVPRLALAASAGPGALPDGEAAAAAFPLPPALLRRLGATDFAALSMIRVEGESMLPTLGAGDDILVDGADAATRLRDGIYVLRADDALMVKRLAIGPAGALSVLSDNPAYPSWPDFDRSRLQPVGRVIWAGRRM